MVKIHDTIHTMIPIDNRLVGKVFMGSNTHIPERIKVLFTGACFGVAEQLSKENKFGTLPFLVNCVFTDYGKVTFELERNQFANVMGVIIYSIKRWSDNNLSDLHILLCMVEELCHYFWGIEDEVEVNYKVLEVVKLILPNKNIEMSDLYNEDWMDNERKKI